MSRIEQSADQLVQTIGYGVHTATLATSGILSHLGRKAFCDEQLVDGNKGRILDHIPLRTVRAQ